MADEQISSKIRNMIADLKSRSGPAEANGNVGVVDLAPSMDDLPDLDPIGDPLGAPGAAPAPPPAAGGVAPPPPPPVNLGPPSSGGAPPPPPPMNLGPPSSGGAPPPPPPVNLGPPSSAGGPPPPPPANVGPPTSPGGANPAAATVVAPAAPAAPSLDDLLARAKHGTSAPAPAPSGPVGPPISSPADLGPPATDPGAISMDVFNALPGIDEDFLAGAEPQQDPTADIEAILARKKEKERKSLQGLLSTDFFPTVPMNIEDTGLSSSFITDLVIKAIYFKTELTGIEISRSLHLPWPLIEPLCRALKEERSLDIKGAGGGMSAAWRWGITSKGIERANEAMARSGYVGPCPVTLQDYSDMVVRQYTSPNVSLAEVKQAFADMVLSEAAMEKIGPAVNSAKSAFLYGPPGNGKTSIAERMCNLFAGAIFVPYAIEAGGEVIKLYDDYVHRPPDDFDQIKEHLDSGDADMPRLDNRWAICKRPIVIVGGELTLDMLDLGYNDRMKYYEAPFQMKSNCGMLLIDDFGRQVIRPTDLLNRWIVPLEKQVDYLSLASGKKLEVPFGQFVVFSTNLDPKDLVDEAFLRRLRYKIEIANPSPQEYIEIFKRTCKGKGIPYNAAMMKYLLEEHYLKEKVGFRACHPRDLLDQLIDRARYRRIPPTLTPDLIDDAWASYFVKL